MAESEIDELTGTFFDAFTNKEGRSPVVEGLKNIFTEKGVIINNTSNEPIIYNLEEFIEPRKKMLSDGTLTDFKEKEISHKTEIFKNIASRFCHYTKSGKLNGEYFESEGMKTIQFIKIESEWKIVSVVWCDDV